MIPNLTNWSIFLQMGEEQPTRIEHEPFEEAPIENGGLQIAMFTRGYIFGI